MFTSSPVSAISTILLLAAAVRGEADCDLSTVYKGASQFLTSLSTHASSLFDGKDSLAGMTVLVPTDKFLDDSGITMFSVGAFQGDNALPVMRRHVFPTDPFADAAASDGGSVRNAGGSLFVTQTRTYASPTNLRISAAGQPLEGGAQVHRMGLRGCGGTVIIHIVDRILPQPAAEINGVLYTNMERLLPQEPPGCTSLLPVLRTIKGSGTFLGSKHIHDLHHMVQPDSGGQATFTVFMPTDDAFAAYETFDPATYSRMMEDAALWRQMASLHAAKSTWTQDEGPGEMQLKTLAWCDTGPCMLAVSVDDAGQGFVRPVRGVAPEAEASTKGVPFCHGVIYTVDEVLRIDDVIDNVAQAEANDIVAAEEDTVDAGAPPGVDYEEDYGEDDAEDVALAPRAVLAPKGGDREDAADSAEVRGSNDEYGGDYEEAPGQGEGNGGYEDDAADYGAEADGPGADAGEYEDNGEVYEAAPGPGDGNGGGGGNEDDGADADDEEEDAGDYAGEGEEEYGDDAADGGEVADYGDIVDPGTVVPTKEEWQNARNSGRV
eukprot:jgi/Ulvmu1/11015/UM007_0195.1